jgi:hypothetical protein
LESEFLNPSKTSPERPETSIYTAFNVKRQPGTEVPKSTVKNDPKSGIENPPKTDQKSTQNGPEITHKGAQTNKVKELHQLAQVVHWNS